MKFRNSLALLLALLLVLAQPALAAGFDLSTPCALTVQPGGEQFREDLEEANVAVDLYRVAEAVQIPGYEAYTYDLMPAYASMKLEEKPSAESWQKAAREAAVLALEDSPVVANAPCDSPITQTDDGKSLSAGLYLLIAHGKDLKQEQYLRVETDEEGVQTVYSIARSKHYQYEYLPELISLPGRAEGSQDWLFEMTVMLKPSQKWNDVSADIVKTLLRYDEEGPILFVFDVQGRLNEELIYSDVIALCFDGPGVRRFHLPDLPVGTELTVTEVYSGGRYLIQGEATQTLILEAQEEPQSLSFINDYSGDRRRGGGVINSFTYSEETNWTLQQLLELPGEEAEG